jgi:hypothetical protein
MVGIAGWLLRLLWKMAARTSRFMDDYFGEASAPGRPGHPGVMTRLENLDSLIAGVSSQVHLNTGHSMRDVVQQTQSDVSDLKQSVDELKATVRKIEGRQINGN